MDGRLVQYVLPFPVRDMERGELFFKAVVR